MPGPFRRLAAATPSCRSPLLLLLPLLLSACGGSSTGPAPTHGTIVVDVQPDAAAAIAATWHLAGPGGTTRDGTGDATLPDLRTGSYTVTWGDAAGYDTPAAVTLELGEAQSLTFTGAYAVTGMIFPDTPDKLMQNFQVMYETMNPAALAPLLHPQYVMILQESTYNQFPSVGTTLDPTEEQRIHERMFSGANVTDPEGSLVPAVEEISFQEFRRLGTWATSLPADQIPDTPYALYEANILVDRGAGHTYLRAMGQLKVYVAAVDTVVAGETRSCYRLRGLADLTLETKSTEAVSWGGIKVLFR